MLINEKQVITNGYFAWDGCHKIYIIEDEEDMAMAKDYDYDLYPMNELKEKWENSCSLRFISNWKLTTRYVNQFEELYLER